MPASPLPLPRPDHSEHAPYYRLYIDQVPDGDVREHLQRAAADSLSMLEGLPEPRASFRYAPNKWSVKQVLGHIIDGERLFAHRALAIARKDPADQPSMDQELWMSAVDFDGRTLANLCAEFRAVRAATSALFATFDLGIGQRRGRASGNPFTVRSLVWTVAGHEMHHMRILRERYGLG